MKQVYPTFILNTNDDSEHPFLVYVPDMEIYTEGDSFANAIEMARDAIGLAGISIEDIRKNAAAFQSIHCYGNGFKGYRICGLF